MSNGSDIEFNAMIDELQNDVDLIFTEGFSAFETKITNIFTEIEKEQKEYNELITKIHNCSQKISNLHADNVMLDNTNE